MPHTQKSKIGTITTTIKITHNVYNTEDCYLHSLTVDSKEGMKVSYREIARNGSFCAVTPYYADTFPEVFIITNFTKLAKVKMYSVVNKECKFNIE